MTITEFILCRVAEEERHIDNACWYTDADGSRIKPRLDGDVEENKARVFRREIAEYEAKRRIVELHSSGDAWCDHCDPGSPDPCETCPTIAAIATVYADHPDYAETWSIA